MSAFLKLRYRRCSALVIEPRPLNLQQSFILLKEAAATKAITFRVSKKGVQQEFLPHQVANCLDLGSS